MGIAECVRSFLRDASGSEVVVVDDVSTDGTGAAALGVGDERVQVISAGVFVAVPIRSVPGSHDHQP